MSLDSVLIKEFGMIGAAVAAVVTQFVTNIITGYLIKGVRPVSSLIIRGLDIRNINSFIRYVLEK